MGNDTQVLTLTDFLLARIAEDEAWTRTNPHFADAPEWVPPFWTRMAAECEAKRRIVEEHPPLHNDDCSQCRGAEIDEWDRAPWPCLTLRALGLPYADHPDYRAEWKP